MVFVAWRYPGAKKLVSRRRVQIIDVSNFMISPFRPIDGAVFTDFRLQTPDLLHYYSRVY